MRVLVAPDKFKGTVTAAALADTVAAALGGVGHEAVTRPLADGGEGTVAAFGGPNRTTTVTGPLGDPVVAEWRYHRRTAVIEMAAASGLDLVGGAQANDPLSASTTGTGELIEAALDRGARTIIVGVGGSATTDGGWGAVQALFPPARLRGVTLLVACDVATTFVEAATVFGPQKGATPAQVELLRRRLERLVDVYRTDYGVDVSDVAGGGAAGGLAGGLAALGADLVPGFELIADAVGLAEQIEHAEVVITGEGRLDATSFEGKVVGGVADMCAEIGREVLVIAGSTSTDVVLPEGLEVVVLDELHGEASALARPAELAAESAVAWLADR